jgi:hypothetical protein
VIVVPFRILASLFRGYSKQRNNTFSIANQSAQKYSGRSRATFRTEGIDYQLRARVRVLVTGQNLRSIDFVPTHRVRGTSNLQLMLAAR